MESANSTKYRIDRLLEFLRQPVDASSVILFRLSFGIVLAAWAWNYLSTGRVDRLYIQPKFHFPYGGFEWVSPVSGTWIVLVFSGLLLLALLIAAGLFYRIATLLFAIGFTYVFLIERTNYQNHYYLVCLISWIMVVLPLNRLVSGDVWRGAVSEQSWVPRWTLWILTFHIAVPYLYGGIAKFTPDWLLGQPMGLYLETKGDWPIVGSWLKAPWAGLLFSYGGMIFDLAIVPLLIWKPTRLWAYCAAVAFHLSNAVLFSIHIFPWLMILATTLFFSPDWVRRVLSSGRQVASECARPTNSTEPRVIERYLIYFFFLVCIFHLVWPFRCHLYGEETSWTERGHLFSWRMMLRVKEVGIGFAVRNPQTGEVKNVNHNEYLGIEQAEKFGRDPKNILSFAKFLSQSNPFGPSVKPEVYVFAAASLNGRKPQLMIDPNIDLANLTKEQQRSGSWIMPLKEPLCWPPFKLPPSQWREYMEIPEIRFMKPKKEAPQER